METETIELREDVYERLRSRKRDTESISEFLDRLVGERRTDWREGFGTLPDGAAGELEAVAEASREGSGEALSTRSYSAVDE